MRPGVKRYMSINCLTCEKKAKVPAVMYRCLRSCLAQDGFPASRVGETDLSDPGRRSKYLAQLQ